MENQVDNNEKLNDKGLILIIGTVFGALISIITTGTLLGFIGGAFIGLIFAIFFVSAFLPHKPHDR